MGPRELGVRWLQLNRILFEANHVSYIESWFYCVIQVVVFVQRQLVIDSVDDLLLLIIDSLHFVIADLLVEAKIGNVGCIERFEFYELVNQVFSAEWDLF